MSKLKLTQGFNISYIYSNLFNRLVFTPTVNNVGVANYPEFFGNMQQQVLLLN